MGDHQLTAADVRSVSFRSALRGYAVDEVDAFLDGVAETLDAHERALAVARERIALLEAERGGAK